MEQPHQVALFDPGSPAAPRNELAANFDPHVMVRWDHRPAIAELDLPAITVDGKTLLDHRAVNALRAAGYIHLKAILAAGPDGLRALKDVSQKTAADLHAWAMERHAAQYALAELALEQPATVTPEVPAVTAVPVPVEESPEVPDGGGEGAAG